MIKSILIVGLGGFLGSSSRYITSIIVSKYFSSSFPLATFIVNIIGSLLIGIILGYAIKYQIKESNLILFLATGFMGGYTTFSAFAFENMQLLSSHNYSTFFLNIALSIIIGVAAAFVGFSIAKTF